MINLTLNKKVIIFGFIFTFFSSFGQSFFLGLFNAPIRNELGITHGQFGSIYASATIFSSLLLIWVGKKIDDYRILNYSLSQNQKKNVGYLKSKKELRKIAQGFTKVNNQKNTETM